MGDPIEATVSTYRSNVDLFIGRKVRFYLPKKRWVMVDRHAGDDDNITAGDALSRITCDYFRLALHFRDRQPLYIVIDDLHPVRRPVLWPPSQDGHTVPHATCQRSKAVGTVPATY